MKSKSAITLVALAIALAAAGGYWLGSRNAPTLSADGAQTETGRKVLYWYDPMTPGTRFDKPGKSPFMDMDLVPRYADEGAGEEAGSVQISARQQQNLGARQMLPGGRWRRSSALSVPSRLTSAALKRFRRWPAA